MGNVTGQAIYDPAELVRFAESARAGDHDAWTALVDRLKGVAWKVLYGFELSQEDRKDAFAATFFHLYERLSTIRELHKLPGWVATTARNEALMLVRRRDRQVPMDELPLRDVDSVDHDTALLDSELKRAMALAFRRLPADAQALMRLCTADPPIGYDEISRLLGVPRGSIGPKRQRCLERLRNSPELAPFLDPSKGLP
jgi:RNA polymerase sigma factor (sigma-70 family)